MAGLDGIQSALTSIIGTVDGSLIGRMLLTLILCGLVGIERSTRERASGFRPHILVGLGACLMTLAGAYGFHDLHSTSVNPLQLASYVISGIGFLGAGAILRHGTTVRGLTTAATLWGAAGIGIAVAAGLGGLAIVATLLVLFTLSPLRRLEARIRFGERGNVLRIHLMNDQRAVGKTMTALGRLAVPVKRATILPGAGTSAILQVELNRTLDSSQVPLLTQRLLSVKDVQQVDASALQRAPRRLNEVDEETGEPESEQGEQEAVAVLNLHDETLLKDLNDGVDGQDSGVVEAAPAEASRQDVKRGQHALQQGVSQSTTRERGGKGDAASTAQAENKRTQPVSRMARTPRGKA